MKVICNRVALSEGLGVVSSVVATRTPKPVLQCVRLVAGEDGLLVVGTDLEVGIRYRVDQVEVSEPGESLVPAEKLFQITRESVDETLVLEEADQLCHVRGKDSHFQVYGQDPKEFPAVAELQGKPQFSLPVGVVRQLVERTLYAAARESTRYAINGVLWQRKGKKLSLVATDGRRLAKADAKIEAAKAEDSQAIVPAKSVNLIGRVFHDPKQTVGVNIEPNQIVLATEQVTLASVLVEGHFPQYEDVIPRQTDSKVELDTSELLSAVRRAALLTNEESKGVRLSFKKGELTLASRAPEQGEATITMPVPYEGDPVDIGFNPTFLSDALRAVGADKIALEFTDPNKPGLLRAGSDFLYVVMPVSLS